jgi:hypothetical protein
MEQLTRLWSHIPFRAMTLLVVLFLTVKEQFPISHFPMYGNMSEEADVIFVTNQANEPLAMKQLFSTGSAATKKRYEAELALLCNKEKRDTEQSTLAERQAAGAVELAGLMKKLKRERVPAGTTELRLHLRTFAHDAELGRVNVDRPAELLASQAL